MPTKIWCGYVLKHVKVTGVFGWNVATYDTLKSQFLASCRFFALFFCIILGKHKYYADAPNNLRRPSCDWLEFITTPYDQKVPGAGTLVGAIIGNWSISVIYGACSCTGTPQAYKAADGKVAMRALDGSGILFHPVSAPCAVSCKISCRPQMHRLSNSCLSSRWLGHRCKSPLLPALLEILMSLIFSVATKVNVLNTPLITNNQHVSPQCAFIALFTLNLYDHILTLPEEVRLQYFVSVHLSNYWNRSSISGNAP